MKRLLWICISLFSLTACSHYTLITPQRYSVGDFYTVEPQRDWSRHEDGQIELWTVDGPLLQAVRFINGIEDGEKLLEISDEVAKMPRFRAHMTPTEVQEFFVGSVRSIVGAMDTSMIARGYITAAGIRAASINASTLEATNLRPARFGELSGFRFDIDFLSREGLERTGTVLGVIHEQKLYLIVYTGARQYYYSRYREDVEHLFASIRIRS